MNAKILSKGILRALAYAVGVFVLCYFLFEIRSILLYIAIAAVIALVGRPMVYFFRKKLHLPNQLSVVLTLLLISSIILGVLALFIPVINQQSENLGRINFNELKNNLEVLEVQVRNYLGLKSTSTIATLDLSSLIKESDFKSIPLFMGSVFGKVGALAIGVLSVLFISFFFLKDSGLLFNTMLAFSKEGSEKRFTRVFNKIKNLLSRYFVGIFLQISVLFILYTILLYTFNVQNPVAVAFICAFLNIVPYLGPLAAGVLLIFFTGSTYIVSDFSTVILPHILYVMAGYLVIHVIDTLINQPLIFGHSVKSHPLEIFLIILIAGTLFGIFGMIVAVPFYTAIKVIAKEALGKYRIVKYLTRGL